MKRMLGALVVACLLFPGIVHAQSGSPQVQRQIEPLLDELMLAANAHDTDRFLAAYVHDSTLVFAFNGVVTTGWDQLRALQLKWWNNGKSDVVYSQHGTPHFTILSPDAVVVTNAMTSRRALPDGTASTAEFAVTMVWQKRPEGWKIVQAHESTVH